MEAEPSIPCLRDTPERERPRERLVAVGAEHVRTAELVAILLRTGTKGFPVTAVAERLLQAFDHSLGRMAAAPLPDLQRVPGVGRDKAIALKAAFELARRLVRESVPEDVQLDSPERVAELLREEMRGLEVETFHVLLVNTRRRLISAERLSQGTLDTLLVHPREVFRRAIAVGAAAIVLAHNHPSGDPSPSEGDIRVTRDLIRAGQLLRIEVLDHLILGRRSTGQERDYVSMRELGYFYS